MSSGAGLARFPDMGELVLGPEFFFLQFDEGDVVNGEHAEFGVTYLFVEFTVFEIERTEFRALAQHGFDFFLLVFEHQPTSSIAEGAAARRMPEPRFLMALTEATQREDRDARIDVGAQ
jgi:hypothetical protein